MSDLPSDSTDATPQQGSGTASVAPSTPVVIPESPCPRGYEQNPYTADLARAWGFFDQVLAMPRHSFNDLGDKMGVTRLAYAEDPPVLTKLDTLQGIAFFNDVSPIDVYSCMHQPGHRIIWETRIHQAGILRRYSQVEFLFYLVVRGIGPVYWPRDFVGVQSARCFTSSGQVVTDRAIADSHRIDLIYTSVEESPVGPQEGKVRGHMNVAGYKIEARGNGCQVSYVLSIDVAAPIPAYIRRTLMGELPVSLARLRDAIPTFGVTPYLLDEASCLAIQNHFWDAETRKSHVRALAVKAGTFVIKLDNIRMYPSGILMPTITGPGARSVRVQEAFTGDRLYVHVDETGIGQEWTLSFEPRDKEPEPDGQAGWW